MIKTFKQHYRELEEAIGKSTYLTTTRHDAMAELRYLVIHCSNDSLVIDYERSLLRSKAVNNSGSKYGIMASEIAAKSVLSRDITRQIATVNALLELDKISVSGEFDMSDFEDIKLSAEFRQDIGMAEVINLRKARANGDIDQIASAIQNTLYAEEYYTEATALRFLDIRKAVHKVKNIKLVQVIANTVKMLIGSTEFGKFKQRIQAFSTSLAAHVEYMQGIDINDIDSKKLKVATTEARQMANELSETLYDYKRKGFSVEDRLFNKATKLLKNITAITDNTSKAAAFGLTGNTEAAEKQMERARSIKLV
ncbi:hypothetical protein [Vibrio alginolyticus]